MTIQQLEKYYEEWWLYNFKDQLKNFIYSKDKLRISLSKKERDML